MAGEQIFANEVNNGERMKVREISHQDHDDGTEEQTVILDSQLKIANRLYNKLLERESAQYLHT